MEFGNILLIDHPLDSDPVAAADELREQARLAEDLGFDSVWAGEHHFGDTKHLFDVFQLLSHVAAVTSEVTIGSSVCLVPLHNPVVLAERTANLDVLSGGRFVFGAGVGYRPKEFEVFGVPLAERGVRMEEALDLVSRLWTEDGVTYEGEVFAFEDVTVNPKPAQDGGPDVWLGANAEAAVERAARRADAWFIDPRVSIPNLRDPYEHYEATLDAHGREPTERPLWREVFVADSREEAVDRARASLTEKYATYFDWGADDGAVGDDSVGRPFDELVEDRFVLGAPAEVAAEIERYREAFGIDHLVIRTRWPGMDAEAGNGSLRQFADEVMPEFQ